MSNFEIFLKKVLLENLEITFWDKLKKTQTSSSKAMADREKKWGRWKYKHLNISRTKRAIQMK